MSGPCPKCGADKVHGLHRNRFDAGRWICFWRGLICKACGLEWAS